MIYQCCFRRLSEDERRESCGVKKSSRVLEAMGASTPLSQDLCIPTPPTSVLCDYGLSTLRSHAVVSPHSTACIIFQQPQFASFTFHADGNGADQGPFPGSENGCEKRKKTEH